MSDAVRQVAEEAGVLRGRRRRAADSRALDDAVATQGTVTQLVSAVRRVAREVPGAAAVIAAQCTGHDYSKPGKPQADWSDPAAGDALAPALVNDANAVVAAFEGRRLDDRAGRSLDLHEHDALLRAARAEWPAIREDYKAWRPDVERAVAQAATQRGAASSPATAEPPPMMPG